MTEVHNTNNFNLKFAGLNIPIAGVEDSGENSISFVVTDKGYQKTLRMMADAYGKKGKEND